MKNAKARLAEWMKNLSETDRKILALTKAGKTLREIGEAVGKSHEFVRQRIAELKAEARKAMEVSGEFQGMVGEQKKGSTNAGSSVGLSQSFPDYRGLAGDEQSLAGAASQFVEHLINIQPKGSFVKPPLEKINKKLQEIAEGKHIPAKSFITAMRDVGFLRSGTGGSAYLKVSNDSTMRLSNHPATAETFVTVGDRAGNISLVLRSATTGDKDFIGSDRVNLLELQFGRRYLEGGKIPVLLADIANFLATGEYMDNIGAMRIGVSGSVQFKNKVRDWLYLSAVNRGDLETAQRMVEDPRYQGEEVHRGVTWQDPVSLKTIITLFEKADSSTLIHEIAHYCFNSMEEAIRDDDI